MSPKERKMAKEQAKREKKARYKKAKKNALKERAKRKKAQKGGLQETHSADAIEAIEALRALNMQNNAYVESVKAAASNAESPPGSLTLPLKKEQKKAKQMSPKERKMAKEKAKRERSEQLARNMQAKKKSREKRARHPQAEERATEERARQMERKKAKEERAEQENAKKGGLKKTHPANPIIALRAELLSKQHCTLPLTKFSSSVVAMLDQARQTSHHAHQNNVAFTLKTKDAFQRKLSTLSMLNRRTRMLSLFASTTPLCKVTPAFIRPVVSQCVLAVLLPLRTLFVT